MQLAEPANRPIATQHTRGAARMQRWEHVWFEFERLILTCRGEQRGDIALDIIEVHRPPQLLRNSPLLG